MQNWGCVKATSKGCARQTSGWGMTNIAFKYWQPGGEEERKLRIFISHRHGDDKALYDDVLRAVESNGFAVQDISLSAEQVMKGPRGGQLPHMEIQAEIAARIYTSDVVIAPSRPAVSRSHWVQWEVQLAAIGYGIPILFVNQRGQQRSTRLVNEVQSLDLPHRVSDPISSDIARNVAELVENTRPNWGVRQEEPVPELRFRGPTPVAMNKVLLKHPYRPRLADVELPEPAPKRGIWSIFRPRDHHA